MDTTMTDHVDWAIWIPAFSFWNNFKPIFYGNAANERGSDHDTWLLELWGRRNNQINKVPERILTGYILERIIKKNREYLGLDPAYIFNNAGSLYILGKQ